TLRQATAGLHPVRAGSGFRVLQDNLGPDDSRTAESGEGACGPRQGARAARSAHAPAAPGAEAAARRGGGLEMNQGIGPPPSRNRKVRAVNMSPNAYDVVVIGAGPAGQSAAELASFLGHSALIVERRSPGGVVTTTGGAPTKTLREVALSLDSDRVHRRGD